MNLPNLADIDQKYVWHPFTQMQEWECGEPFVIERGEGCYLYDIHGRKYLDGISSLWVTVHGHRKKEIDDAIKRQIDKISHSTLLGLANVPSILLAERLVKITPPNLTKVFYSDNGSTAVEIALKMAFQYWRQSPHPPLQFPPEADPPLAERGGDMGSYKTKFLTFDNAYHGDTLGSVSVGGIDLFHQLYKPLLFNSIRANFENVEDLISRHADELAAVIIEPVIQGAAGMRIQPRGFLKILRSACDQNNVLLIFDEVATGFGRTGWMFACEQEEAWPDFLCLAKGLTGGYLPLAATLTTEEVYRAFCGDYKELKTFFHGHTYTGNPLACSAALANLDLFEKEKTLEKLQSKIAFLKEGLKKFKKLKHVREVRQAGFMVGIELARDGVNPYNLEEKVGIRVIMEARRKGVILRPLGDVIVLLPPLSITLDELDFLLKATYEAISVITEQL